ncbi:MAG: amidase [Ignavibacteria bacterium]|nr:amidase [Ignavibacteria bacterium]MCU7505256.1 amidase [Ignavibacteria bacterium]MCU7518513.1 amidase [Ignavibacteria bacterium]
MRLLAVLIFLGIIALAGCSKNDTGTNSNPGGSNPGGGGTDTSKGTTYQVMMKNTSFSPSAITVTAGTTVTWTNMDSYAHTVTSGVPGSPDGKFDSGNMDAGATYSHKFDTKGTYAYYCRYHSSMMKGTVTVQ